jgi:tetratricopeptide (TPR) repeat protein
LAIALSSLGPHHPDVGELRSGLGRALLFAGRYSEALAPLTQALAVNEENFGPDTKLVAGGLRHLAAAYDLLGRAPEALAAVERALTIGTKAGEQPSDHAVLLAEKARADLALGRYRDAIVLDEQAITLYTRDFGPSYGELAFPLGGIGQAWLGLGQPERAIPPLERALALCRTGFCRATPQFALAQALSRVGGDPARARALAVDALAVRRERPEDQRQVARIEAWLAAH